ncbi:MAG: tetratricopeptide repeat protein [Candidatus Omnitrophica bacterium]|nr:tetratricopeptide repeat protein [Candidatus Omnitrophota bacterium]
MSKKKKAKRANLRERRPSHLPSLAAPIRSIVSHPWGLEATAIVLALSAVYSFSMHAPTLIVHEESVLNLPLLAHPRNIPTIASTDFMLFTDGQYRPFSYIVLSIVRLFVSADNIVFWHGWLLLFHGLNALLVLGIVRHFTESRGAGLAAALAFALHPLSAVLINNIDVFYLVLSLTLTLGALKAYLTHRRSGRQFWYWLSVALFLTAMGSARPAVMPIFVVGAFEWMHDRSEWKRALVRMSPFLLAAMLFIPLWTFASPHPLHFKYVQTTHDSFWHGLYSFVGGTGKYLAGFLLTRGLYETLHETVAQIYSPWNAAFLLWAAFDALVLAAGCWAVYKKRWAALGVLMIFFGLAPFATVAYNRVIEWTAWKYFYFPLAGFALLLAGAFESIRRLQGRVWRNGIYLGCICAAIFFGMRSIQYNLMIQNPLEFWLHSFDMNPNSEVALYEIGKAYLAKNEPSHALHFFFAPMIKEYKKPCLVMARYYARRGEFLASAIHLRYGSGLEATGRVLEPHCEVGSELLLKMGALDHAEEHLGKLLMVNPYDVEARGRLARVWFMKGFVREAYRQLDRIREIDPASSLAERLESDFRRLEFSFSEDPESMKITPPSPDWLNYILTQSRNASMRESILQLSDRLTKDPIVQLEAGISSVEEQNYSKAAEKMKAAMFNLSGNAYACAVACRAFALSGNIEEAVQVGMRAISLDQKSTLAWDSLALAHAHRGAADQQTQEFMNSIAQRPKIAAVYFYNLGVKKAEAGALEEACDLLEKAAAAQPDYFEAHLNLGKTLVRMHQPERAVEALQKGLAYKRDEPELYQYLGRAYFMQKQNEKGIESLQTAIKINPEDPINHFIFGMGLESMKDYERAAEEYRRAIQLNSDHTAAHFMLANCFYRLKRYPEADAEYLEVAKLDPGYEYAYLNRSSALHSQGKLDEAIAEAEKEIQHNPQIKESYERIVEFCCEKGDYQRAREAVRQAEERDCEISEKTLAKLKEGESKGE